MSKSNQPPVQSIMSYLPWAQSGLLLAIFTGVVLVYFNVPASNLIFVSLGGLAIVFFLRAFKPLALPQTDDDAPMGFGDLLTLIIAPKIIGISSAICVVGILFYLLNNIGYQQMLFIGSTSLGVASLILIYGFIAGTKHIKLCAPMLMRAIPILILAVYILLK